MFKPLILSLILASQTNSADPGLLSDVLPRMQGQGGFSALELNDDGTEFFALSDQGYLATGKVVRNEGVMSDLAIEQVIELKAPDGTRSPDLVFDTEGLALDGNGGFYISLEGPARVWHYESITATPTALPTPEVFARYGNNSSLEALAIQADGHLLTMPERSGRHDRPFPVYEWDGRSWTIKYRLGRMLPFLLVGADIGPDGALYVLERDFEGFYFRSRVRRINPDITAEIILTASHDNLEGISVWRDSEGAIRLTMISDNNLKGWLPTRVVEYRLDD